MGLLNFLTGGLALTAPVAPPVLGSPFASPSHFEEAIVTDILGEMPSEVITPEIAMRVPEVKRALKAHTSLVAPLRFEVYRNGERVEAQPFWVSNTAYPIASPYLRIKGCVSDLFMYGWALLGAELGPDGLPHDLIHIPRAYWNLNDRTGLIEIDESIPVNYRHPILIPLGSNGLMVDGIDSIRQARLLELARQARIATPPAATELHITDPKYDEMSKKEKEVLAKSYADNRNKHSVSVTPSYIDVKDHNGQPIDLFEAGMNSLRIQIANHAGVPASFIEGGKEGGSAGQMSYSNEADRQSELWLFGSSEFAYAIAARLSMDDVVGPDAEVRADTSTFAVPAPTELSTESAPETPEPVPAPAEIQE